MVEVALGIVEQGGRYLIALRPPDVPLPSLWEFPGGKQEPAETLEQCAVREVREELGLEVEIAGRLAPVEYDYPTFRVRLHPFRCCVVGGQPKALGCAEYRWVAPEDLHRYSFPPATLPLLEVLRAEG